MGAVGREEQRLETQADWERRRTERDLDMDVGRDGRTGMEGGRDEREAQRKMGRITGGLQRLGGKNRVGQRERKDRKEK